MKRITVKLEATVADAVQRLAYDQSISVSAIVPASLQDLLGSAASAQTQARRPLLEICDRAATRQSSGPRAWSRDTLHERDVLP